MMAKIFLVGMMGAGKTLYAKKWARAINAQAYDLDRLIQEEEGMSIQKIFTQKGENYFRAKESELLKRFGSKDNFVLATGGGAPCYFDNMKWMNENGITIWLNVNNGILFSRLKDAKEHRPLLRTLNNEELKDFINKKMTERKPYYSLAQFTFTDKEISTDNFKKIMKHDDE